MVTIVLICAFGAALLVAAGAAFAARRARAASDRRVAEAVAQLAAGMHETMRELTEAVETAQANAGLTDRYIGELSATLDLDEVTERTLEATGALTGVEAAYLDASAPEGARINATYGHARRRGAQDGDRASPRTTTSGQSR